MENACKTRLHACKAFCQRAKTAGLHRLHKAVINDKIRMRIELVSQHIENQLIDPFYPLWIPPRPVVRIF